ncbi:Ribose methyltransferase [Mortierella sp. AD032]|nr:Ribose methyltransferase [Mortierella sp. AD032]
MSSSSSLSLAPVRSIRSIRSTRTIRTPRTPWRHVSFSFLGGDRQLSGPHTPFQTAPFVTNNLGQRCTRCLSTSRPLLTAKPPTTPLVTPKISKYRVDCNSPKVIKRTKKAKDNDQHVLKAVPNVVRAKPVANPKKAREAADAKTREIMNKLRETEAEAAAAADSSTAAPKLTRPIKVVPTPTPTSLKPEASKTSSATVVSSTLESITTKGPAPIASQSYPLLPSVLLPQIRLQPAQQPLPGSVDPIVSTLAGSIATQPAPISSGWSTRSPLQSYRLPHPELMDQRQPPKEGHPTLDPLPKMASSIERRPSQAPQRIKRSVYRTILDWSVHPTVQPMDFNALPDLTQITPSRVGHSVKSPVANVTATVATNNNNITAKAGFDETVVKKRYVSRRRIGFDDDDDLDLKFTSRQRRPSVVRLERDERPRSAPSTSPPLPPASKNHPRQTTTQVLDAIVKHRLGQNNDTQGNPWSISGIRKQRFFPAGDEKDRSVLLKRPVFGLSDNAEEKEKVKTKSSVTTTTSEPFQSTPPFISSSHTGHAEKVAKAAAVHPQQSFLKSWREPRRWAPKDDIKLAQDSTTGEYLFSPKAVLPALTAGLRKPFELLYTDSVKHPRTSQLVQECVNTAHEMGVDVVKTTSDKLDTLLGHRYHQGVLLRASFFPKAVLKSLGSVSEDNTYDLQFAHGPAKVFHGSSATNDSNSIDSGNTSGKKVTPPPSRPPIWVALDEVQTIYDMGQIMNAAYYLGIDGVIIKDKDTVLPLAGVSAASGGTMEKRPAYAVSSLVKFIKESQGNGWQVIGIKAAYGSKRMNPFYKFPSTGIDRPTVLVLGSNGLRLHKNTERQCDSFIHVPTLTPMMTGVDSLPVPVISGIIMSRLVAGRSIGAAGNDENRKVKSSVDKSRKGQAVEDESFMSASWTEENGSPPEWEEAVPRLRGKGNQNSRK